MKNDSNYVLKKIKEKKNNASCTLYEPFSDAMKLSSVYIS